MSYSIDFSRPVSIQVETFDTGRFSDEKLAALLERHLIFAWPGFCEILTRHLPALHKGRFYRKLAAYGQVGRVDLQVALGSHG